MAQPRDGVYVWITWLSKVMAGEQSCEWASWFKAHYTYSKLPNDFDIVTWTVEHTKRLRELNRELRNRGEEVSVENENSIKYVPMTGVTVAGKPDLISTAGSVATIYDVKTGQPKTSDTIQVMIYMYLVPWTVPKYRGIQPSGCVVYGDNRVLIPPHAITETFAEQFRYFLNVVTSLEPAIKVSGPTECRFCDIPHSDCQERHIQTEL
jgi:predicted RecB family nuclease